MLDRAKVTINRIHNEIHDVFNGVSFNVFIDDELICSLEAGSTRSIYVSPGEHKLTLETMPIVARRQKKFSIELGNTLNFKCRYNLVPPGSGMGLGPIFQSLFFPSSLIWIGKG
jgi:hypothetical protein